MGRDPKRKPPKRVRKPTLDGGLMQLASVIAEYQLDNNAYGWFRLPWRDGINAVGLCLTTIDVVGDHYRDDRASEAMDLLDTAIKSPTLTRELAPSISTMYERAGELAHHYMAGKINTNTAKLLIAGLRCLQLKIANSHGGGAMYNEWLIPTFLPIEAARVEDLVLEWRCHDSIGTGHQLRGDRNDRQREAFTTAWRRGLYMAAYSIQPAF